MDTYRSSSSSSSYVEEKNNPSSSNDQIEKSIFSLSLSSCHQRIWWKENVCTHAFVSLYIDTSSIQTWVCVCMSLWRKILLTKTDGLSTYPLRLHNRRSMDLWWILAHRTYKWKQTGKSKPTGTHQELDNVMETNQVNGRCRELKKVSRRFRI